MPPLPPPSTAAMPVHAETVPASAVIGSVAFVEPDASADSTRCAFATWTHVQATASNHIPSDLRLGPTKRKRNPGWFGTRGRLTGCLVDFGRLLLCGQWSDAQHARRSVPGPAEQPAEQPDTSPASTAAAAAIPVPSPAKPIRMVTDPRPAKPVMAAEGMTPPDDDNITKTAAERRPTERGPVADTAAVMKEDLVAEVSGAGKASSKGGGIGRHRLPEAEPKLEEAKVPRSKACCGGCSIM